MMESGAFRDFYDRYYPDVLRFVQSLLGGRASSADVDDIVQTVFVKVATTTSSFRGESGQKTWLFAIARNTVHDFARQSARSARRSGPSLSEWDGETRIYLSSDAPAFVHTQGASATIAPDFVDPAANPESAALSADERARVRACIDQLPEAMRAVVICRLVSDLSVSETADVLGWTSARVRVTYSRALRKFQSIWESAEELSDGRSLMRNQSTATTSSK